MMSCTHGSVVYSANLFIGETFKHTHLQHLKSHKMGTKFFCNDVICKYWPYATKVANVFSNSNPEYKKLTKEMKPFLSRFHGEGHPWHCRVQTYWYLIEHRNSNSLILRLFGMAIGRKGQRIC